MGSNFVNIFILENNLGTNIELHNIDNFPSDQIILLKWIRIKFTY